MIATFLLLLANLLPFIAGFVSKFYPKTYIVSAYIMQSSGSETSAELQQGQPPCPRCMCHITQLKIRSDGWLGRCAHDESY